MIIFLRRIPATTKLSDLLEFVRPAITGGLFRKSGRVVGIKILELQDKRFKALEFHGLITVEPDAVAARAIDRLKGQRFKGKLVVVRQYNQRDWHNDPRQNHKITVTQHLSDRRKGCRRRGKELELVRDISENFSSSGDFVRKNI
ncbi:RNA recognition motif domain-containing protein [Methylomonas rivi]|uniref:RNA-binding protein n=1 Tax=Methylomonas rivi TaxID=2952226 RepID=A0ABT1U4T3_9GAMM|nr:RNA-binding protein [Methylomonas sp. WSC-6]MBS4050230.1 RNA-binding protein [Methylomonas sp.]MCQ8128621.1 RNA-binding protein [Methylomonas sp. WSC-6]